jgi:hypothetical protein
MDQEIISLTRELDKNQPPDPKVFREMIDSIDCNFPEGYLEFMREHNGAEGGVLGGEWLRLEPVEDLQEYNDMYGFIEELPDIFFIGSNGGGDAFGIRRKEGIFIQVPLIGICEEDILEHGNTFKEFLTSISKAFEGMEDTEE